MLLQQFWRDEVGAIVCAELVTVGTVAVLGTMVGLNTVASSINGELTDMARAIRSLDQSYSFAGFSNCRAWSAGSTYRQQPVAEALQTLCAGDPALPQGVPTALDDEDVAPAVPAELKL